MTIENKNFNNSLKEFQNIKLDANVKADIKSKLLAHTKKPVASDAPTIPSPYFSYLSIWERYSKVAILCVFVLSFATAFASTPSLPGDILYPVKTKIVEPVVKFAQLNKEAEIKYEASLAQRRVEELEQLKAQNRLTQERVQENKVLFQESIAVVENYRQEKGNEKSSNVEIDIDTTIFKYSSIVASISSTTPDNTVVSTSSATSTNTFLAIKGKGKKIKTNLKIIGTPTTSVPVIINSTITLPINSIVATTTIDLNIQGGLQLNIPVNIPVNTPANSPTNSPSVEVPAIKTPVIQTPAIPIKVNIPKIGL